EDVFNDYSDFFSSIKNTTEIGPNGFSELQIAANIIYSLYSVDNSSIGPSPQVTSQYQNYNLWSIDNQIYNETINNGLKSYKDNVTSSCSYYNFKYGCEIEYFVLNVRSDRTPMKIND